MSVIAHALRLAEAGIAVFPCRPDKKPFTSDGFKAATTDIEQVRVWWQQWPGAMIGLPTGKTSRVWVLDIDAPKEDEPGDGYQSLEELTALHGQLPATRTQKTGSGGRHYFFRYPQDRDVRNSAGKVGSKIDVRGEGGYVILAPSATPDGRKYVTVDNSPPAEAPEWLLDLVSPPVTVHEDQPRLPSPCATVSKDSPYIQAAVDRELEQLASAPKGERNHSLNKAAFALGQWVGGGALSEQEAVDLLFQAASRCGLVRDDGERQVHKTIASGLASGRKEPRQVPASASSRPPSTNVQRVDGADASEEGAPEESRILPPPPPVPLEAFPPVVRAMMEEAAAAFTVPLQIVTACFLAFLSCLVGRSRLISIKPGWEEAGNLWIALVAMSGMGKSPCMAAFFRVITWLEYEAKRTFDEAFETYETELALYQVERNLKAKEKAKGKEVDIATLLRPEEPKQRQTTADDVTVEALGDILQGNPKGVLWLKDELSGLLFDLDKYSSNGGGGTKARLLSSHSLGAWKTNRSSKTNRNNFIPKACVGIFGGIQPGVMSKVFEAGAGGMDEESGFLPRFLFIRAVAESPAYWSERTFSRESITLLERIAATLWPWDVEYDDQGREIDKVVPVSRQAKALYVEWFNAIAAEAYLAENAALLRKLQAHALRLCLLLHSLDAALTGTDGMTLVTEETMHRALLLADWTKTHQAQCWRFFRAEEKAKQADPIEQAIMQVVVEQAAKIEADGWKIGNADLFALVEKKLNMPGLSDRKIGKAASGLGLTPSLIGERRLRGRLITQEKINEFRSNVSNVSHVSVCSVPTMSELDSNVSETSHKRLTPLSAWEEEGETRHYRDMSETVTSRPESLAPQQSETCETCETLAPGHNPEFDFNDRAYPDEDRVEL